MRKIILFIIVILFIVASLPMPAYPKDKKGILLSTLDTSEPYEVIGIVYGRIGTADIKELNTELERRAVKVGADAVIGVRYMPYVGYLYAYGTAVKFEE